MSVPFKQVDVFTSEPYRGNPVAVVLQAQGMTDEQMRRIANWTNLSETTFVLPPTQSGADYLVRIFTPQAELPFAGHPTLGTAHALLEAGIVQARGGRLVQECAAGLIDLSEGSFALLEQRRDSTRATEPQMLEAVMVWHSRALASLKELQTMLEEMRARGV